MSDKSVLLYNMREESRMKPIRRYLNREDISFRQVLSSEYMHPIGYLFDMKSFEANPHNTLRGGFHEEMIVLKGITGTDLDRFYDYFSKNNIPMPSLCAVLTPINAFWSSVRLYESLFHERDQIKAKK